MSRPALLLLALCLACLSSCTYLGWDRSGSGRRATEERTLEPFLSVRLDVPAEVRVTRADLQRVAVTADDDLLGVVSTRVRDGVLIIATTEDVRFRAGLQLDIQLPRLDGFLLRGRGHVDIRGLEGERFLGAIEGEGTMLVAGDVDQVEASIHGRGQADLRGLSARRAELEVNGDGRMEVSVSEALHYRIDGSGDVFYRGDPRVSGGVLGSGRVRRFER